MNMMQALGSTLSGENVKAVKSILPIPNTLLFDDSNWSHALRATQFEDFTTERPAESATTALLLYDDKNLYVAWVCEQHESPITVTQHANDVGYGLDDEVTFALDTSGNNSQTYAFTSTPTGVRYEYSSTNVRYQPNWHTSTAIDRDGYRVLMTIPLADLRFSSHRVQTWRFNFSRWLGAKGDLLTWAYDRGSRSYCLGANQGVTIYCDATRWPRLIDIALGPPPVPPPSADVYGLLSAGRDRSMFEATPENFATEQVRNMGIEDLTIPITSTLSLVGTLAPDFSNVELDQTTIAPQEFPRQYAEYRTFFSKGAYYLDSLPSVNVLSTSQTMLYTPELGVVDYGALLQGKVDQSAIGALTVNGAGFDDQAFGYGFQKPDGSLGIYAQGVNANHSDIVDETFGFGTTYQNLHSGLEPLLIYQRESGTYSTSSSLAQDLVAGSAFNHGPWQAGALFHSVGPQFDPIDGYISINDITGPQAYAVYNGVASKKDIIKSFVFFAGADRLVDRSGAAHVSDLDSFASVTFKNLISASLNSTNSEQRTYSRGFPTYADPFNYAFDSQQLSLGYAQGTSSPAQLTYSFGRFPVDCYTLGSIACAGVKNDYAAAFTQNVGVSATRAFHGGFSITAAYSGTIAHALVGSSDSQWLRSITLTRSFTGNGVISLSLRNINGTGGFAYPGENLALTVQKRFNEKSELFFEYGSPAAYSTLQRFILKFVYHVGQGSVGE